MTPAFLLAAVLRLLLPQAESEAAQVEREKERLRARPPLTAEQKSAYTSPAPPPARPREPFALAVVPVGFSDRQPPDAELAAKILAGLTDYYARASSGRFKLEAKVSAAVTFEISRDQFERKHLEKAVGGLGACDGVAFLAAGGLVARNAPLWPHRGVVKAGERELDYLLVPAEAPVGILAHEFMHLLGFADKYDDEKASVADACILGTGYSVKNPPPPCAACRIQLGWTSAASVDPGNPVLLSLDADPSRALRIPLTPEGDEALLLEARDRLLVWHVGGGKKVELIGRFPTESSDRLTPLSLPPFRGRSVGARTACLTDIRIQDGKAWFQLASEAPLTPFEEWRRTRVGKRLGD